MHQLCFVMLDCCTQSLYLLCVSCHEIRRMWHGHGQYIFFHGKTDRQTDIWPYRSSMPELKNSISCCGFQDTTDFLMSQTKNSFSVANEKPMKQIFRFSKCMHIILNIEALSYFITISMYKNTNKQAINWAKFTIDVL